MHRTHCKALKSAAFLLAALLSSQSVWAALAQAPLVNRQGKATANLLLIMDTSGSMDNTYIYQYGDNDSNGDGKQGPAVTRYAWYSPDVNLIRYDPRIYYAPRVDYLGNALTRDNLTTSNWKVYFRTTTGAYTSADLGNITDYIPNGVDLRTTRLASDLAPTSTVFTYPHEVDVVTYLTLPSSQRPNFPRFKNRTECANLTHCTLTEERRNYTAWRKWYSTRGKMMQTAMGQAFQEVKSGSMRLGYAQLSQLGTLSGTPTLQAGVNLYTSTAGGVKETFFNWLYGVTWTGGTSIMRSVNNAGKYFERTDNEGPWSSSPVVSSTGVTTVAGTSTAESKAHLSCRRSYAMVVTDGYYTDLSGYSTAENTNFDGKPFTVTSNGATLFSYSPFGTQGDGTPEFRGDRVNATTLADLAMYYWGRDLRPDLRNRVASDNINPSTWQNMTLYGVTLGLDGTLPQTPATLTAIGRRDGSLDWPTPVAASENTIDDLWHATLNSRGQILNARSATELKTGLKNMFEVIAGAPDNLSGVVVSTTILEDATVKYKPEYTAGTWTGNLSAIHIGSSPANDDGLIWKVEKGVDSQLNPISTIPAAGSRTVYTWNSTTQQATLFTDTATGLNADLVNYIKGDASKEVRNGGSYRDRTAKLGDIVNSNPVYVLDTLSPTNTLGVIFVGANDGMLHGFRADTGVEIFAYVPQAVWGKLSKLTLLPSDAQYSHQYYVDGPLALSSTMQISGEAKRFLLGTTGAGARAVFALDVTQASRMSNNHILWEINNNTTGFSNLGHVMSAVQTGELANGTQVAIFGNGFDSTSGHASLYIVNIQTGALLKEIVVDDTGSNALGGVYLVRSPSNQRILGAYAGDLKGNLWKFDLSSDLGTITNTTAYRSKLYAAGASKPITAMPTVLPHPTMGYMVNFGSGKLMESSDATASETDPAFPTQSIYGVWDARGFASNANPVAIQATAADLREQTISPAVINGVTSETEFSVSNNAIAWGDGSTGVRGWYIDLPNAAPTSGQRVISPVRHLIEGSGSTLIKVNTMSPINSGTVNSCSPSDSGKGWFYTIDGLTGAGVTEPIRDTNGDGFINSSDAVVSGGTFETNLGDTIVISGISKKQGCMASADPTAVCFQIPSEGEEKGCVLGDASCTLLKPEQREWRRLFLRD